MCHHYHFADKLRLVEGMGTAQGHRLGKGSKSERLQVHRSLTSYPVKRPHPGLPYPDPSPVDRSFPESKHNLKPSQVFAEDLPGDRPPRAAQNPTGQLSKGGAGGQSMGWKAWQELSTAHSTQACYYYY